MELHNVTECSIKKYNYCFKRFHRGKCNNGGLIVPKLKREEGKDSKKPAVSSTNLINLRQSVPRGRNRTHDLALTSEEHHPPS
jgi:hypothetical protein